jgi:hypothetical protein
VALPCTFQPLRSFPLKRDTQGDLSSPFAAQAMSNAQATIVRILFIVIIFVFTELHLIDEKMKATIRTRAG